MKQCELISYAYDFVSQLLDNQLLFDSIEKIILFGSVARGDFSEDSDLDLFIDLKSLKKQKEIDRLVKKEIDKFEVRSEKGWVLRGICLPIKVIVGEINHTRWKDLKEEILGYGKLVYGKFEQRPEKLEHQVLITYELKNISQKKKMAFLREIYGYTSKKGNKKYVQEGLLSQIKGEKKGSNNLIIKLEELVKVRLVLNKYRIKYWLRDFWSK